MKIEELHAIKNLKEKIFYETQLVSVFKEMSKENILMKEFADKHEIKLLEDKKNLEDAIFNLNKKINESGISNLEKNILMLRYIFLNKWDNIQKIICYSRTAMFNHHRKAIKKILSE